MKVDTKNFILNLVLIVGIILIALGIVAFLMNGWNINFLISTLLGIGIMFVLLKLYSMTEMSLAIPYFLGGIFAILGLAPIIAKNAAIIVPWSEEETLNVIPLIPLYISMLIFSGFTKFHKSELLEYGHKKKWFQHHKKAYVIGLDALVVISTAILFYLAFTQIVGLQPWTISRWWQEGYYAAVVFMSVAIHQRDSLYYHTWGHWLGYFALTVAGVFLIFYPLVPVVFANDTFAVISFFGAIFNTILGLIMIYYAYRAFFAEEVKEIKPEEDS